MAARRMAGQSRHPARRRRRPGPRWCGCTVVRCAIICALRHKDWRLAAVAAATTSRCSSSTTRRWRWPPGTGRARCVAARRYTAYRDAWIAGERTDRGPGPARRRDGPAAARRTAGEPHQRSSACIRCRGGRSPEGAFVALPDGPASGAWSTRSFRGRRRGTPRRIPRPIRRRRRRPDAAVDRGRCSGRASVPQIVAAAWLRAVSSARLSGGAPAVADRGDAARRNPRSGSVQPLARIARSSALASAPTGTSRRDDRDERGQLLVGRAAPTTLRSGVRVVLARRSHGVVCRVTAGCSRASSAAASRAWCAAAAATGRSRPRVSCGGMTAST